MLLAPCTATTAPFFSAFPVSEFSRQHPTYQFFFLCDFNQELLHQDWMKVWRINVP
jgi:hypothetical protein